jgi:DNA-binding Lrp family transcriptional regulator
MRKKDILIISRLRAQGRETLTNLSRETHVPISTIFEKLRYQYSGIIKRPTLLIDFPRLGFVTIAHVAFRIQKEDRIPFRDYITKHPHVNSVYRINNGFDFLCECIFRNVKELEDFLERIEEMYTVHDKNVYYIIEEIKKECFMADPELVDLIFGNELA